MTEQALHYSEGKPGVDQIPPEVLLEWGKVFSYGGQKYAKHNWRKGTAWSEFYGSLLRHLFAGWSGKDVDPESGLSHWAHALWCVGALLYFQQKGIGTDDRPCNLVLTSIPEERTYERTDYDSVYWPAPPPPDPYQTGVVGDPQWVEEILASASRVQAKHFFQSLEETLE